MEDNLFYEDLVAFVKKDYENRCQQRLNLERQWELNINFIMGNQYADVFCNGEIREVDKDYFWQSRKVYNRIAPIVEARISRLNRVRPIMSVRAMGDEDCDLKTAKLSTNILHCACANINLSKLITKATNWSEMTGTCFYKVLWNPKLGKKLGETSGQEVFEGDVECSVIPPFEIYPDRLTAEDVSDCKSLIHARALHVDDIFTLYGEHVNGEKVCGMNFTNGVTFTYDKDNSLDDYALVIERYERPSPKFPNGRVLVVCQDKLLYSGDLPFENGESGKRDFPFVRQVSIPVAGCFFGMSIVERIIPVQKAFNAVKNRKHEFMNRISMGVLTVEDGAVDVDELTDDGLYPGKVIVYRQGANPPTFMSCGNLPNDFTYEEEMLKNEFTAISGVSEFSRSSQALQNMTSGVALQLLIEQDDNRMISTIDNVKEAIKGIAKQILRLYKQFAVTKRIMKIAGENQKVETFYFANSDISGDEVVFDTENELSCTPAQKRSAVYELINSGLLNDEYGKIKPTIKSKLLDILGFGSVDNLRDLNTLHVNKAERENLSFLNNEYIKVDDIDDHNLHVREHTAFLLSDGGKEKSKAIWDKVMKHIHEHSVILAESMTDLENGNGTRKNTI